MKQTTQKTAYFHLPGLFEFYELYELFLPLFRKHREYFYDWCEIGSIYGAPIDCIWWRTDRRRRSQCAGSAASDAGIWYFHEIDIQ